MVLVLLLAGCNPNSRNWPVKGLEAPADAERAGLPRYLTSSDEAGDASDGMNLYPNEKSASWGRAYNYAPGWEELAEHFDSQLTGLGYGPASAERLADFDIPGEDRDAYVRSWSAPDGRFAVVLFNCRFFREYGLEDFAGGGDYLLIIDRTGY